MRKILAIAFLLATVGLCAQQQSLSIEAQAFESAMQEAQGIYLSHILMGYSFAMVTLVGGFLLLNLRIAAFVCLVIYGAIIMNIPYYVPETFQRFFGLATILIGILGVIIRAVSLLGSPKKAANKA